MEKIDPNVNIVTIGGALYDSAAPNANATSDPKVIHHAYVSYKSYFALNLWLCLSKAWCSSFFVNVNLYI